MNQLHAPRSIRLEAALRAAAPYASRLALSVLTLLVPGLAGAQITLTVTLEPPLLPAYAQPALPEDGMLWAPGYWEYGADGYYWVPGTWVQPPAAGLLWTPGYWRWNDGSYVWSDGYWDREVGYYGGVNYGYGYVGNGYQGGYWSSGRFYYNRSINNLGHSGVRNVYTRAVTGAPRGAHVSYNGGAAGTRAHPSPTQVSHANGAHEGGTAAQSAHRDAAAHDHGMLVSVNGGHPTVLATPRPITTNMRHPSQAAAAPVHVQDLPPAPHVAIPPSGNADRDGARQQQQESLRNQQEQERRALQAQQTQEHAALSSRSPAPDEHARLEQQHQAQTQELVQRHSAQQETLRQTQQRPAEGEKPRESHPEHP